MEESRLGVIFPSGRLAKRVGIKLIEREWMTSAATMAKKYDVPVIPVHISARNSYLFYIFDLIHPTLRDITLFKETLNKKDFKFHITIGQLIEPRSLSEDPKMATSLLKSAVNSLGNNYKEHGKTSLNYYLKTALKTVI
jgi:putative hemolysin